MKKDIILLHGALGNPETMKGLGDFLSEKFRVYQLAFPGHGAVSIPDEEFTINRFSQFIVEFADREKLDAPLLLGYSMGGYAALLAAANHVGRFSGVVTLATKLRWSPEFAQKECGKLNIEFLSEKAPAFIELLGSRFGQERVGKTLLQTSALLMDLGKNNPLNERVLAQIECNCLLGLGSADKMVTVEETQTVAEVIPQAQMLIIPDTPHQIEMMNPQIVGNEILKALG